MGVFKKRLGVIGLGLLALLIAGFLVLGLFLSYQTIREVRLYRTAQVRTSVSELFALELPDTPRRMWGEEITFGEDWGPTVILCLELSEEEAAQLKESYFFQRVMFRADTLVPSPSFHSFDRWELWGIHDENTDGIYRRGWREKQPHPFYCSELGFPLKLHEVYVIQNYVFTKPDREHVRLYLVQYVYDP